MKLLQSTVLPAPSFSRATAETRAREASSKKKSASKRPYRQLPSSPLAPMSWARPLSGLSSS